MTFSVSWTGRKRASQSNRKTRRGASVLGLRPHCQKAWEWGWEDLVQLPALPSAGVSSCQKLPSFSATSVFPSVMKLLHLKPHSSLLIQVFSIFTWESPIGRMMLTAWLLGFLRFRGRWQEEGSNIRGTPPYFSLCPLPCWTLGPEIAPQPGSLKQLAP